MVNALSLLAALLLVRFVALEAQFQRARRAGQEVRFPAGATLRVILGLGIPICVYATYQSTIIAQETGEWWLPTICLAFVALAVFGDPGEIRTNSKGVELIQFFGLRRKLIRWKGAEARHIPGLREVLVVGGDGIAITHSQNHVGQDEFLFELGRHGVTVQGKGTERGQSGGGMHP